VCGPEHSLLYQYEYVHWRVSWPRMASGYILFKYDYCIFICDIKVEGNSLVMCSCTNFSTVLHKSGSLALSNLNGQAHPSNSYFTHEPMASISWLSDSSHSNNGQLNYQTTQVAILYVLLPCLGTSFSRYLQCTG
jgi:hypothetical protein